MLVDIVAISKNIYDNQSYCILNKKEIDLSSYEKRKELKEHILTQIKELEQLEMKLKKKFKKILQ